MVVNSVISNTCGTIACDVGSSKTYRVEQTMIDTLASGKVSIIDTFP